MPLIARRIEPVSLGRKKLVFNDATNLTENNLVHSKGRVLSESEDEFIISTPSDELVLVHNIQLIVYISRHLRCPKL